MKKHRSYEVTLSVVVPVTIYFKTDEDVERGEEMAIDAAVEELLPLYLVNAVLEVKPITEVVEEEDQE